MILGIMLIMGAVFFYGVLSFPYSPIEACPTGYCGKGGHPYSATEYQAYREWLALMSIVWPTGMLTLLILMSPIFKK